MDTDQKLNSDYSENLTEEKRLRWEQQLKDLLRQLAEDTSLHGFKQIHDTKGTCSKRQEISANKLPCRKCLNGF